MSIAPAAGLEPPPPQRSGGGRRRATGPALLGGATGPRSGPFKPVQKLLLDAGESIKALANNLGHADPGFTLRTYTHLMPSSEERTRKAID